MGPRRAQCLDGSQEDEVGFATRLGTAGVPVALAAFFGFLYGVELHFKF